MEVILDTNFIITCVKNSIQFVDELQLAGFRIMIPKEIIDEMKDLRLNVPHDERVAIDLAMEIIEKRKLEKTRLPKGKVDDSLIHLGKKGAYIATLDNAIRKIIPNKIGISSTKKSILVERN